MTAYFLLRPAGLPNQGENHPSVGLPLDRLALRSLDNPREQLKLDDLKGRTVLVNFWGTWCPPCRAELPKLADLERKYRAEPRFLMLAVSCGQTGKEDYETLRRETLKFLAEASIDLPTFSDPASETRLAAQRAGAFNDAYPTTVIFDDTATVRAVFEGYEAGVVNEMDVSIRKILGLGAE